MFKRIAYGLATFFIGVVFVATSEQASAVVPYSQRCAPVGTILNTTGCHGYVFNNTMFWSSSTGINGGPIIYSPAQFAIPFTVNSPATLEAYMANLLGMSNPTDYSYGYNKEGAAFIIATMLGHVGGGPGDFGNPTNMIAYAKQNFYPNAGNNFKGWTSIVDYYGSGNNSNYSIDWGSSSKAVIIGQGTINTLHACPAGMDSNVCQPTTGAAPTGAADSQNFAWYALGPGETEVTHPITFYGPKTASNPSGVAYIIRRECGNPLGGPAWPPTDNNGGGGNGCTGLACNIPSGNFTLSPNIQVTINGAAASGGSVAQAGDVITFNYYIDNTSGNDDTSPVGCSAASQNFPTFHPQPGTPETLSGAGTPATTCPQTFSANPVQHQVVPTNKDTVTAADGYTYCRTLTVDQTTPTGGPGTKEECVYVASKPYVKVFGGDVAAGTAFASNTGACSNDSNAQILAWNKQGAGYSGAGAQYAAFALSTITGFATNQNGAGAGTPSGLAFANSTANLPNIFGGGLGSWQCMPDYYDAGNPTAGTPITGTSTAVPAASGSYYSSHNLQITASTLGSGQRVQMYVNGDVYISGDIKYNGSWSVKNMPLFEIVAKGNIYIADNNGAGVKQLDGIYVAQPQSASVGGTIYTCATNMGAPADVTNPSYYVTCSDKLTVNGSLVANTVELLRTFGSTTNSKTTDSPSSNNAAESINGSPAFWIPPSVTTNTSSGTITPGSYDYINSLPPIL